ncbi:MAG TPA: hypothetical protein PK794_11735 [Armatimonadota bacterium]|nr:hypothetical protein [Armatimonadota bacterium]
MIHTRAPIGLLTLGGWTATPWAMFGMACTCAGEETVRLALRPRTGGPAVPPEVGMLPRQLLHAVLREFALEGSAVALSLPAEADARALAALAVAATAACAEAVGWVWRPPQLAWTAHRLLVSVQGSDDGLADILAAVTGTAALHRIEPYPRAVSTVTAWADDLFASSLLQVWTGRPPDPTLMRRALARCRWDDQPTQPLLWRLRGLAPRAHTALRAGDPAALGEAMEEHSALLIRLAPALRTPEFAHLHPLLRQAGAASLIEGPDRLLLLCPAERQAALPRRIETLGYRIAPVRLAREGIRAWREDGLRLLAPMPAPGASAPSSGVNAPARHATT